MPALLFTFQGIGHSFPEGFERLGNGLHLGEDRYEVGVADPAGGEVPKRMIDLTGARLHIAREVLDRKLLVTDLTGIIF
jgi:hypothetical protein